MPVSRKRTKPSPALAGIPGSVLSLSPREWEPNRRAAWCRAYIAGAASPDAQGVPTKYREQRWAYQQGQRESASNQAAVRQSAQTDATRRARRTQYEREREAAMGGARNDLLRRLDDLSSPHDDPRILHFAEAALNMVGGTLVPIRKDGR